MAWLPFAKLEITDGTTTIDLINQQTSGFCIIDWQPAIQDLKASGTWADAPTADERELIASQLANVEDQFTFDVSATSTDLLIGYLRSLRAMLNKARQYTTTTWQDTPVYIVAQGYGDSNARYTRVKNWRTPQDGFPYGPPMWDTIQGTAIDDFSIIIEHGAWLENAPGVGTATEISAVETYDGRNLGNVDSTGVRNPTDSEEVYVTSKRVTANITDIYTWSAANGFSANLMDAALPFNLLDDVGVAPAVNDYIGFCIDSTLANSGPFNSLVFDLSIAGAGYTGHWEYWSGVWTTLVGLIQDNTATAETFDTLGVNSINWQNGAGVPWVTLALNGITGYWVRFIIDTLPGGYVTPVQQNRDIYSITWPYVEIQAEDIGGDIPAQILVNTRKQSGSESVILDIRTVLMGLRSLSRGSNFTAYLNCSDEQNPTNVTVAVGAATAFTNKIDSPTGRVATYSPAGVAAMASRCTVTMSAPLTAEYYGKYHGYLRVELLAILDTAFQIQVEFIASSGGSSVVSPARTDLPTGEYIIDLGVVSFPFAPLGQNDIIDELIINVQAEHTYGGALDVLDIIDVILIPVDEWACEAFDSVNSATSDPATQESIVVDSVSYEKVSMQTFMQNEAGDRVKALWTPITNRPAMLQANTAQRLWFFMFIPTSIGSSMASIYAEATILIERNQRYWSMRGGS